LKKRATPRDAGDKPALRRQRIRRAHDDVAEHQQDTEARGSPSDVPPAPPRPVPGQRRSGR
jgi:hypothetical protein